MKDLNRLCASSRAWIAAFLMLSAGFAPSSQAIVGPPVLLPGDSLPISNLDPVLIGSFVESHEFSLGATSGVSSVVTYINISGTSVISPFSAQLWSGFTGGSLLASGTGTGSGALLTNSFYSGTLGAGDYRLEIGGTGAGSIGGVYSGSLTVTPAIPEPEIWAMMAIGAGLVGWRTRRRAK